MIVVLCCVSSVVNVFAWLVYAVVLLRYMCCCVVGLCCVCRPRVCFCCVAACCDYLMGFDVVVCVCFVFCLS